MQIRESNGNIYIYEDVYKNFKWNVPEYFNFTADIIDRLANEKSVQVWRILFSKNLKFIP